jgi:Fic family protein
LQSERKPHYALETATQRWGKAYIRKEDKSIQASREVLEIIRHQRDQKPSAFAYGDEERSLLRLLETNETITLRDFIKHTGVKPAKASKVLVTLTLTNVLKIIPAEPEDKYIFNAQSSQ